MIKNKIFDPNSSDTVNHHTSKYTVNHTFSYRSNHEIENVTLGNKVIEGYNFTESPHCAVNGRKSSERFSY